MREWHRGMGYFTKEVAPAVNYTNHRHSELRLGMEWIGPKWLPLLLPMCVGGSSPLHSGSTSFAINKTAHARQKMSNQALERCR